ncbi:MAG: hypothetical protein ACLQBA_11360 [Candidatus Binataceae bacterium]
MAKIVDPLPFSRAYELEAKILERLGVLDPTLNVDTKLFVDPFLLRNSKHPEIKNARVTWEAHFSKVIDLLAASRARGDVAWRSAEGLLTFREVKWTCLGYGAATVSGSGSGAAMRAELMTTAKEIVDLGVTNPDLFAAMALFEDGMGPDRISDMTCRVILPDLFQFNRRILRELKIPTTDYEFDDVKVRLAANPKLRNQPVVLVPLDILRSLPIAADWDDVSRAVAHNESLRRRVNNDIGNIWAWRTRRDKAQLRDAIIRSKRSFDTAMDMLNAVEKAPYEYSRDPEGEFFWRRLLSSLAQTEPFNIEGWCRSIGRKVIGISRRRASS